MSCDLVALAVSLDGNGIKFGLGDNGNLGVEVDAEIYVIFCPFQGSLEAVPKVHGSLMISLSDTYSPVITTSGD